MRKINSLSDILAEKYELSSADAERLIREIFSVIRENLAVDKLVKVKGLGTFKLTEVNGRSSVDVNTGERIHIESHSKITFTPENAVRDRINAPFAQFESFDLVDGVDFEQIDNKYNEQAQGVESIIEKNEDEEPTSTVDEPTVEEPVVEEVRVEDTISDDVPVVEPVTEPVVEEYATEPEVTPMVVEPVLNPIAASVAEETTSILATEEPCTAEVVEEPCTAEVVEESCTVEMVEEPCTADVVEEPCTAEVVEEPVTSVFENNDHIVEQQVLDDENEPQAVVQPVEPESNPQDNLKEELRRTNTLVKLLLCIVVFLVICIVIFGAYVYFNHNKSASSSVAEPQPEEVVDTTAQPIHTQVEPGSQVEETPEVVEVEEQKPKDYKAVGVEKEIILEKNMSLKDICKENGGDFMRDFIRDANGGKKKFDKGETVIIPKLEKRH